MLISLCPDQPIQLASKHKPYYRRILYWQHLLSDRGFGMPEIVQAAAYARRGGKLVENIRTVSKIRALCSICSSALGSRQLQAHAAEALGRRNFETTVEPAQKSCLPSDASYINDLRVVTSADSALLSDNVVEKALYEKHDTQDAPAYYAELSRTKAQRNTPKHRELRIEAKTA